MKIRWKTRHVSKFRDLIGGIIVILSIISVYSNMH